MHICELSDAGRTGGGNWIWVCSSPQYVRVLGIDGVNLFDELVDCSNCHKGISIKNPQHLILKPSEFDSVLYCWLLLCRTKQCRSGPFLWAASPLKSGTGRSAAGASKSGDIRRQQIRRIPSPLNMKTGGGPGRWLLIRTFLTHGFRSTGLRIAGSTIARVLLQSFAVLLQNSADHLEGLAR